MVPLRDKKQKIITIVQRNMGPGRICQAATMHPNDTNSISIPTTARVTVVQAPRVNMTTDDDKDDDDDDDGEHPDANGSQGR